MESIVDRFSMLVVNKPHPSNDMKAFNADKVGVADAVIGFVSSDQEMTTLTGLIYDSEDDVWNTKLLAVGSSYYDNHVRLLCTKLLS